MDNISEEMEELRGLIDAAIFLAERIESCYVIEDTQQLRLDICTSKLLDALRCMP